MLATPRRREAAALAVLVAGSAAVRALASRGVPTPWIAPDEMVYGLLGQGLYRHGALAILGGPTPFYSAVVPAIVGAPLGIDNLALGYTLLKILQGIVMSLAAVPVYFWTRSLARPRYALLAAALTLALPGLAYSGLVMTEVVFYPVFVLAAWTMARAIATPTRGRQLAFVAAGGLAVATRLQAVVLVPVFLTAIAIDALLRHKRLPLRRIAPAVGAIAAIAAAWTAWRIAAGKSLLAGYSAAGGSYPIGKAAEFVAWHAGDLVLLTGVFPLCAVALLLARGGRDAGLSAYLAVAVSAAFWIVVQVGVFASRELDLLAERNLIGMAPVLFVGFAVWLDRGAPGGVFARAAAGFAAGAAVLAIPLGRFATAAALPHAFSIIPLYHLRSLTSFWVLEIVFVLSIVAVVALFVLARGRALVALPVLLLVALAGGSVSAGREVATQARAQQLRLLGPERRWIDAGATGPVAYIYDGQAYWNAVWENAFWNRRIQWIYDLPETQVPGPIPQQPLDVSRDGQLRPSGATSPARFAVVPLDISLRGRLVAQAPQLGTDRQGLGLWRLDPPLRIDTITSGLFPNGDIDVEATLAVYGCDGGTFDLNLLVKSVQTVTIDVDGKRVVRRHLIPQTWDVRLPVPPTAAGANRICRLRVDTDGALGSVGFTFNRG